jgi:hypothetical protein
MMLLNGFILVLPGWLVMSLRDERSVLPCKRSPLSRTQQALDLKAIDLLVSKIPLDLVNQRELRAVLLWTKMLRNDKF